MNKRKAIIIIIVLVIVICIPLIILLSKKKSTYEDFLNVDEQERVRLMEEYVAKFDENIIEDGSDISRIILDYVLSGYSEKSVESIMYYDNGYDTEPFDVYKVTFEDETYICVKFKEDGYVEEVDWD